MLHKHWTNINKHSYFYFMNELDNCILSIVNEEMVNIARYADVCTQNNRVGATIAKKTF